MTTDISSTTRPQVTEPNSSFVNGIVQHRLEAISFPAATLVATLRDQARSRLDELAIPTTRDEDWKYTDLSRLVQHTFTPDLRSPTVELDTIQPWLWPETEHSRLVFVNGWLSEQLSDLTALPNTVTVKPLSQVQPEILESYLQKIAGDDIFTTLNTACLSHAAIIQIPQGIQLESPIHILSITLTKLGATLTQPRCLIVANSQSSVHVIEDFVSPDTQQSYFTNAVTEIWVEANAQVTHTKFQREGPNAFQIAKTAVHQARDSRYSHQSISLGGSISRHTLELTQAGEQAETILRGLALCSDQQLADTHTAIDHRVPYGASHQIHKCIVRDRGHAVFNGKLLVQQAAQLTNANQSSRNLLLSSKAKVDTKPQLEIFADNVKCSHGATVSQLEADEVFYLRSRGIDEANARDLLTYAFAAEIVEQVPIPSIQQALEVILRSLTQSD